MAPGVHRKGGSLQHRCNSIRYTAYESIDDVTHDLQSFSLACGRSTRSTVSTSCGTTFVRMTWCFPRTTPSAPSATIS